ncbi:MAG: hypothetical protein KBH07_06165 [Flavobacteriales bacterium]|nr:hypothetical protein [Flavobacteriales bacterium]
MHIALCESARTRGAGSLALLRTFGRSMRRTFVVLVLAAIVGAVAWWLFTWKQDPVALADPWSAMPANAVAVLAVPEPFATWAQFTGTSQFWGDVEGKAAFAAIDTVLRRMARLGMATEGRRPKGPLVVAWHAPEGNELVPLLAWPLQPSEEALGALGTAFGTPFNKDLWNGVRQHLPADTARPALELAWSRGLLLVGTAAVSVEEAVKATTPGHPEALFATARRSLSAGADAHLLARADFVSHFLQAREQPIFPGEAPVEGWLAMDVRFRPDAILLNGLLFPREQSPATAAMTGQPAARPGVLRVLPATVAQLRLMQVNDPAAFVLGITGAAPDPALFTAYGAWVQGGVGVARDADSARWAVLQTNDPEAAADAMRLRCPDGGCPVTEYRGVPVARMADAQALSTLFGKAFSGFHQPLWAVLGNNVVCSVTPAAMRAAIDAWVDRNSLALDPRTGDFFDRFASEAVYSWWVDVPRAYPAAAGIHADLQRTMGAAILQLAPRSDGAFIATFCLQHAPTGKQAAGALWTTAMPAPLAMPPMLVEDYLSKTQQILVQDRDDRISLISCTGKVLWQRQLDGPILGGVEQIDRFRNDKLQLLLNTARKVYLIDRLGRDVEGFPVVLKAPASAPLSAFDYEGNREYRIVLPLEDRSMLNLGPDGLPVKGWDPKKLDSPALAAVQHVRIKGKDYLVVPQRNGHVAVLGRRGEARYQPRLHMAALQYFLGGREAMDIADRRLLWADSAGAVLSGTLAGRVDTLSPAASGQLALFDPGGDARQGVLRTLSSMLSAEVDGTVEFRPSFPEDTGAVAFPVDLGARGQAIGLVLPGQHQLRLYDLDGGLWPGFPLKGAVRFLVSDINRDGVAEVVTADAQGVVLVYTLAARP